MNLAQLIDPDWVIAGRPLRLAEVRRLASDEPDAPVAADPPKPEVRNRREDWAPRAGTTAFRALQFLRTQPGKVKCNSIAQGIGTDIYGVAPQLTKLTGRDYVTHTVERPFGYVITQKGRAYLAAHTGRAR